MGYGGWSEAAYTSRMDDVVRSGAPKFDYSHKVSTGAVKCESHESLDPKKIKGGIREARDSAEHPNSCPVFVGLDVTGSMKKVPEVVQEKLPALMGLLTRRGYLDDPAVCVAAIGDVAYDRVPFEVGQFETGIEIDNDIRNMYLEGGGGGNMHESYEIALFFLDRMVKFDAFEKREKKGYAFIVCDEELTKTLKLDDIKKVFGSDCGAQGDINVDDLLASVVQKWELYCIIPKMTQNYDNPKYSVRWRALLGERVLRLDDPSGIAELIASTIGIMEENVDIDSIVTDLKSEGASHSTAESVSRALVNSPRSVAGVTGGKTGLATI